LKKPTLSIAIAPSNGKMITEGDASKESYSTVIRHTDEVTRYIYIEIYGHIKEINYISIKMTIWNITINHTKTYSEITGRNDS
jgi:hypothetical protein